MRQHKNNVKKNAKSIKTTIHKNNVKKHKIDEQNTKTMWKNAKSMKKKHKNNVNKTQNR